MSLLCFNNLKSDFSKNDIQLYCSQKHIINVCLFNFCSGVEEKAITISVMDKVGSYSKQYSVSQSVLVIFI